MGMINQGMDPWAALFSRTRRRILDLLYGQPGQSFYVSEIVRLAGVGTGSVQRELSRLAAAGILSSRRIGNQVHYRASSECPFFDELCTMVRKLHGAGPPAEWRNALRGLHPEPDLVAWFDGTAGAPPDVLVVSSSLGRATLERQLASVISGSATVPGIILLRPGRFHSLVKKTDPRLAALLRRPATVLVGDAIERLSLEGAQEDNNRGGGNDRVE